MDKEIKVNLSGDKCIIMRNSRWDIKYDLIIQLDTEIRNMQMAGECLYEIQRMKQEFKWAQKL